MTVEAAGSIPRASTLAVLGPNGAGKTTLLHAIAGVVPIDAGRIEWRGECLDDGRRRFVVPEQRDFGVVFQDRRLFDRLTVRENVAFGLRARGRARSSAWDAAAAMLETLDAGALIDVRPPELSGGQAQRVALARMLVTEPAVALLDEPFAAIDVASRAAVRSVVAAELARIGATTVLVTHDAQDARVLADQVVELEGGAVRSREPRGAGG